MFYLTFTFVEAVLLPAYLIKQIQAKIQLKPVIRMSLIIKQNQTSFATVSSIIEAKEQNQMQSNSIRFNFCSDSIF